MMLVTLTNGLQILASFIATDGDDGSNDCILNVFIDGGSSLRETGRGYGDYDSSEILKNVSIDKDRKNGFTVVVPIPYYRIHSIVDSDSCPYAEPLHNHHDGCPACDSTYKPDCTPSLEDGGCE